MAKTAVAGLDMKLVEIAMAYQRSRVLCATARLGVADALKEGERSVQEIAGIVTPQLFIGCCERSPPWALSRKLGRIPLFSRNWVKNCVRTRLIPLGPPSSSGPICWRTIGRLSRNACARAKARLLFGRKS